MSVNTNVAMPVGQPSTAADASSARERVEPLTMQSRVLATRGDQIAWRAILEDAAVADDEDAIGDLDRGEAMRDDERGSVREQRAHGVLHEPLAGDVQR